MAGRAGQTDQACCTFWLILGAPFPPLFLPPGPWRPIAEALELAALAGGGTLD